jgi:hypothetical protein
MGRTCSTLRTSENCIKNFGRNPERRRLLERFTHSWMDNINTDLREMRWSDMYWIELTHNKGQWLALVNTVNNSRVPYSFGIFLSS